MPLGQVRKGAFRLYRDMFIREMGHFLYDSPCPPQCYTLVQAIPACQPNTYTRIWITQTFQQKDHFLSYTK